MLDNRTTELIALGASVAANCGPCLQYHITKALEAGISEQEIKEAIEVGRTVRKGAALKMDQFAASWGKEPPMAAAGSDKGCGCGC